MGCFAIINKGIHFKIQFEACIGPGNIQEFDGVAVVEKKVILFGGEGSVNVFKTELSQSGFCSCHSKNNQNQSLKITFDPIVSSDIRGSYLGGLVDGQLTKVIEVDGRQLVKIIAWYDNEMGYSYQMVRTLSEM